MAHFFISCFSRARDDLGQWRAYACNGRGFALAFDRVLLEGAFDKAAKSSTSGPQTFRVTYSDRKLVRLQTQIIEAWLRVGFPTNASARLVRMPMARDCLTAALLFKHKAYKNEDEYRFLELHAAHPPPEVKHRTRPDGRPARYREFDWRSNAPEALKKVIIGPAADKTEAAQFAEECLRAYHRAPPVKIICSSIPYSP